ncbi:MAG: hypothetical protein IKU19_01810 [Clostridia bacterium]|nr:hypothetical protein [Clostridia bacterium]
MINQKSVDFKISPYLQESAMQIVVDIISTVIISVVFILADFPLIVTVLVIAGYFVMALFFHYKVTVQALTDKRKKDYVTERVSIKEFKFNEEYSFAGNRLGHSNARLTHPKEMHVCRYKISLADSNGEEIKLRSAASFKRAMQFAILDKYEIEQLQVTYLKRSKILIRVDLADDIDKIKSRKKRDQIKKVIHTINTTV